MKKFLSIMLSITFALTLMLTLSGCNDSNNSLANNINQSVKKVRTVLEQTTEVSNEDLVFEEIMSLSKTQNGSASASTISNTSNKVSKEKLISDSVERIPAPNLTRQIVKKSDRTTSSTLGLISNDKLLTDNSNNNNTFSTRLSSFRKSDSSRLTSAYYTPRKTTSVNYNNASFVNYLGQVEDLYLMMNDAVCANDNINSCKNSVLEYCDLLDVLSQKLKSKEIQLTEEQANSCNGLLNELGNCTNKVASSRNDVQNGCNTLKQSAKNTGFKVEQINSNYIKLINSLDRRESYYEGMLSSLKQIQAVLAGNSYISDYLSDDNINGESTKNKDDLNDFTELDKEKQNIINKDYLDRNLPKKNIKDLMEEMKKKRLEEENLTQNNTEKTEDSVINPTDEKSNETLTPDSLENNTTETENSQKDSNSNIDTYQEQTIKPNVIDSRSPIQRNQNNNDSNKNENQNNLNNNQNKQVENQQTPNSQTGPNNGTNINNGVMPNTNTYGLNGIQGNNVGMGGVNGVGVNGVGGAPGIGAGIGGVGAGVGVGGVGSGVGVGGVGTGVGGVGGYTGIHNYENGVLNPYRNTDTYKLSLASEMKPLPSETRKDFKPFVEIASQSKENIDTVKTVPLQVTESKTETTGNQKVTIKTFKIS